ncbi:uncharacterized protein N7479_008327 [Penicillium vulpinum]|uniref:uncharacterized protein n=1 Tax=Penicillium vulpinum TaxID=29845 RepID=UPI002547B348|nr:uncharacterized protein N7479_008327 [Penicillium vulpinum]KAJ5961177.1 hypothetical protein N7479_008327 [Penicillium vulpinum]
MNSRHRQRRPQLGYTLPHESQWIPFRILASKSPITVCLTFIGGAKFFLNLRLSIRDFSIHNYYKILNQLRYIYNNPNKTSEAKNCLLLIKQDIDSLAAYTA